jgi:hypothetical protein
VRRRQPDVAFVLVVLRDLVELELQLVQLQLLFELQRVQLVVQLVVELQLLIELQLVVLGLTPARPAPGAAFRVRRGPDRSSSARTGTLRPHECRTHFMSSGNVGFFPYMRMPTR